MIFRSLFISVFLFTLTAFSFLSYAHEDHIQAQVSLESISGSGVTGNLHFNETSDHVEVWGKVYGLDKKALHAFHIHEFGDCGNDGKNAGDHFNPDQLPHGHFSSLRHHRGDLPQLHADHQGNAEVSFITDQFSLSDKNYSILGKALVIHAQEDQFTQPSGDAGEIIACGVIQLLDHQ